MRARCGRVVLALVFVTACSDDVRVTSGPAERTVTVRLEVTSSGRPIAWTGFVSGSEIMDGTTPFSRDFSAEVTRRCVWEPAGFTTVEVCEDVVVVSALVRKTADSADTLTACVSLPELGERMCQSWARGDVVFFRTFKV